MKKETEDLKKEKDQPKCYEVKPSLDSDVKVKYYTGLSSADLLKTVFDLAVCGMKPDDRSALPLFDQFTMTLMKLRLNLGDVDLAFRFSVSQASVSRYINFWIDRLFVKLSFLIMWPE